MCRKIEITVEENMATRLDALITAQLPQHTRSFIKGLVDAGNVLVNGRQVKAGYKPKPGDHIEVRIPERQETGLAAQDIPLDIVYQDEDIAVINKPQGMVTHPAAGNEDGTLVNAILYQIKDLSGIGGEMRPGIVHRLDKDTSGAIVIAKNDEAHASLGKQLQERSVKKIYIALLHGNIKDDSGTVVTYIGRHPGDRKKMAVTRTGREAVSHYRVLKRYGAYTLVEFTIETGRTHQIRVHAKHIGHPVVGDALYTKLKNPFRLEGQMLHAQRLRLIHPRTGEEMEFEVPLPVYFTRILDRLRGEQV